ncbi:hypothetical protein [Actinacidiphila acididurans]|uniref:Secreted protein n=1 Tax=Actinacidiphila acididurans TaxID=2784346 RepID=A0ABS2TY30_9ACTN|nr:hypothetical protein [Actinacidiphila acididurans]MBM9507886.1 hypothetical protein [Actinacidiphila acididurans]
MPIQARALVRGGTVLVTAAAAVAVLVAPAATTEAEAQSQAQSQAQVQAQVRAHGGGTTGGRPAESRQIASSVLDADENAEFTLTAIRSTVDPLAASVRLKAFVRQHGRLVLSDEVRVGAVDGWFWFPVTGLGAICEFSTASTNPAPITVSLLITPAVGCSLPEHFELRDGKFEADGSSARAPHGGVSAGGGGMAGRAAGLGAPAGG